MHQLSGDPGEVERPVVLRLTRPAVEHLREHGSVVVELRLPVDRRAELQASVAAFVADHPEASANEVQAAIGGRRSSVLSAVGAVRARSESGPAAETPSTRFLARGTTVGLGAVTPRDLGDGAAPAKSRDDAAGEAAA